METKRGSYIRTAQDPEHVVIFEPDQENDIFLTDTGYMGGTTVSYEGKVLGTASEWEDVVAIVREALRESNMRPNVWQVSDHGNVTLVEDFYQEMGGE